jgi:hypothetical protein
MKPSIMSTTVGNPTLEFLRWLEISPRTYAETMEAWQTSCPRFSTWEDSLIDGLVCVEADSIVTLTPQGRAILEGVT